MQNAEHGVVGSDDDGEALFCVGLEDDRSVGPRVDQDVGNSSGEDSVEQDDKVRSRLGVLARKAHARACPSCQDVRHIASIRHFKMVGHQVDSWWLPDLVVILFCSVFLVVL